LYVEERDPEEIARTRMVDKIVALHQEKAILEGQRLNINKTKREVEK
jgi:hypothetical protein